MKTEDKDQLKSLFQDMKLNEPSAGFESRLMQHIYIVNKKQERRKSLKSIFAIAGGILGILGIPAAIFWYIGLPLKSGIENMKVDFSISLPDISFDPSIISIAFVVLLLLIGDTLIRRRIWEKKHKHE